MPIGHSPLKVAVLSAAFFLVDCIPPTAVLYSIYYIYTHLQTARIPRISLDDLELEQPLKRFKPLVEAATDPWGFFVSTCVPFYLLLEAAFFVFFLLQRARLQRTRAVPLLSDYDRPKFFFRMMDELPDEWAFRKFFAGWFHWKHNQSQLLASEFHEIYKNDMRDWLAWAFFSSKSYEDVGKQPNGKQLMNELDQYILDMEQSKRIRFETGRNPAIKPVRLNFNKVEAYPKPIFVYTIVFLLECLGCTVLRLLGFDKYNSQEERFMSRRSGVETPAITYWARFPHVMKAEQHPEIGEDAMLHMFDEARPKMRPKMSSGAKKDQLPIVFFHGIGGGLFSYIGFIYRIVTSNSNRAVFLVELPYVSMRLVDHVPSMQQTVAEVEDMLDHHGFTQAFFIGHSLGTALTAWMMNNSKVVAGSALLDPIVFKTYHPSLAYNFVYRHPGKNIGTKANEYLMHWLVARELYISYFISRHFCWHQNVMWPENLPKTHLVVVSSEDQLIDGETVVNYLEQNKVNYVSYPYDHAEFLTKPWVEREIVQKLNETVQLADAAAKAKPLPSANPYAAAAAAAKPLPTPTATAATYTLGKKPSKRRLR
ncbi:hypothetical protein HDU96_003991 [Phlyctochytrium bullatum]|nr:hypothetical protein HDU96_003991 [Phlyctochytrium bullatum]